MKTVAEKDGICELENCDCGRTHVASDGCTQDKAQRAAEYDPRDDDAYRAYDLSDW